MNPNDPSGWHELTADQQNILSCWIQNNLRARKRVNRDIDSYMLKHKFELSCHGFYVTNGSFKGAMLAAGYQPSSFFALNWTFAVSFIPQPIIKGVNNNVTQNL